MKELRNGGTMVQGRQVALVSVVALALLLGACSTSTGTTSSGSPRVSPTPGSASMTPSSLPTATPTPTSQATELNPAGDIPDTQAYVTYHGSNFTLLVPEGWARSSASQSVTFTDKLNSITAQSVATSTPTVASITKTPMIFVRTAHGKLRIVGVSHFVRAGGGGVLLSYQADSLPNPVTFKVVRDAVQTYIFWRKGTALALSLSGPTGADNVDPWRKVSDSFRWTQ